MSANNLSMNLSSYREKARISSLLTTQQVNFEKTLQSNHNLITIEDELLQEEEKRNVVKKKKIQSYVKNRDTLYIEPPERVKKPIDISKNLIEKKVEKNLADLGIQSDEINYVDKSKPYLQQKIGKDASTQIEDGDLFKFDRDVEPIITVILGKLMEQVNLELNEEDEIKRIREAKLNYTKRIIDEKQRVIKVEEEEIKKKRDIDNIKKLKKADKSNKANVQRKIISRMFSKNYFKNLKINTLSFLKSKGLFNNYLVESTKDKLRGILHEEVEKFEVDDNDLDNFLDRVDDDILINETVEHQKTLNKKKQEIYEEQLRQEELKRQEEEEAKRKWEGKLERAKQRKIKRLKEEIQKSIFDQGVAKNEIYAEDISEIDNFQQEGGYIGILGGSLSAFMISMICMKTHFLKQDSFYVIDSIIDMILSHLTHSGKLIISLKKQAEEEIKDLNPDIELKTLNTNTNIESKDWKEIGNILSNYLYCGDVFLRQIIDENNLDTSIYTSIIKAVIVMLERGKENDKIQFIINSESTIDEILSLYKAFCILNIENSPSSNDLLAVADWNKDRKRKNIKVPEFNSINKVSKYYTPTSEYKILIYDKTAEFLVRNKILENMLKAVVIRFDIADMDATPIFYKLNEMYDIITTNINYSDKIQFLEYQTEPVATN